MRTGDRVYTRASVIRIRAQAAIRAVLISRLLRISVPAFILI
jgi:hypothetical protein